MDSLETMREVIPIVVGLRAMASFRAVQETQTPYQQGRPQRQRIGKEEGESQFMKSSGMLLRVVK
jgi:hypothetical protein